MPPLFVKRLPTHFLKETALLFFLALLSVWQGYQLGVGDLATYIPFVLHHHQPSLYSDDLLVRTIGDHPVYIWKFFGWLLNWFTLESVFKFFFFLQILVIGFSARFFYRHFFGKNSGWIIFLLMLVISHSTPASGRYGLNPYHYFHPAALAVGTSLFVFALLDQRKWIIGGALTGCLFLFHPITAVFVSLLFFLKLIIDYRNIPKISVVAGAGLLILVAAPAWIPVLQDKLTPPPAGFDFDLWYQIVRVRFRHTFFISQWLPDHFLHIGLIFLPFWFFRRHPAVKKTAPIILASLIVIGILVLAEIFRIKFMLQLQTGRNLYFLYILLSAFVAHQIRFLKLSHPQWQNFIWLLLGYFLMLYPFLEHNRGITGWLIIGIIFSTIGFILSKSPVRWQRVYFSMAVILVSLVTGLQVYASVQATGKIYDRTHTTHWEDMQRWCRNHISEEQMMMTPFYIEGFRSFSRRSIYGSFKDGAPHNFSENTIGDWWGRMQQLGVTLPENPPVDSGRFPYLYHQNAIRAAVKTGIRYMVYDKLFARIKGKPLYENSRFGILDLTQFQHQFVIQLEED